MILNIDVPEEFQDIKLKETLAIAVICQARFDELLLINQKDFLANFQSAIIERFPKYDLLSVITDEMRPNIGGEAPICSNRTVEDLHTFIDEENQWQVELSTNKITLSTVEPKVYTSFEDFMDRFTFVVEALCRVSKNRIKFRYLGLRYVNSVSKEEESREWNSIINKDLLGIINFHEYLDFLGNSYQEIRYKKDSEKLIIRHGLNLLSENSYILDYDCSRESLFTKDEMLTIATNLHEEIYRVFIRSLNENYLRSIKQDV